MAARHATRCRLCPVDAHAGRQRVGTAGGRLHRLAADEVVAAHRRSPGGRVGRLVARETGEGAGRTWQTECRTAGGRGAGHGPDRRAGIRVRAFDGGLCVRRRAVPVPHAIGGSSATVWPPRWACPASWSVPICRSTWSGVLHSDLHWHTAGTPPLVSTAVASRSLGQAPTDRLNLENCACEAIGPPPVPEPAMAG